MANTFIKQFSTNGLHVWVFTTASASAAESVQLPVGKTIVSGTQANIAGTSTTTNFKYTTSTGVGVFAGLTAADPYCFICFTD